ncbi:MAG TPA: hypothetical protein VIL86_06395 [Tepidisphaeraceae bacterium]
MRASFVLFVVGGVFLAMAPLILSREGEALFAVIGSLFVLAGLYTRSQKGRRS